MKIQKMIKTLFLTTSYLVLLLAGTGIYAQSEADNLEKKQRYQDSDRTYGTFTMRFSYGLYDYQTNYYNPSTEVQRIYTDTFAHPFIGFEMAFRMGHDKYGFYAPDNPAGFHYYRSNRGIFTDFEIGMKTYYDKRPTKYNVTVNCNGADKTSCNGQSSATENVDLAEELYYYDIYGITTYYSQSQDEGAKLDNITPKIRKSAGQDASIVNLYYFNNFFHFTPLNYLLNFGSSFKWFDASIGPSLRIFHYADYGDYKELHPSENDNSYATIAIVYRQYVKLFSDSLRWRLHYYWPAFSEIARLTDDKTFNEAEQVIDTGIDIYLISYFYITVGYEYHIWNVNSASEDRFNTSRPGFEMTERTSGEFYGGIAIDWPLGR